MDEKRKYNCFDETSIHLLFRTRRFNNNKYLFDQTQKRAKYTDKTDKKPLSQRIQFRRLSVHRNIRGKMLTIESTRGNYASQKKNTSHIGSLSYGIVQKHTHYS